MIVYTAIHFLRKGDFLASDHSTRCGVYPYSKQIIFVRYKFEFPMQV